jgi:hypothetical protein
MENKEQVSFGLRKITTEQFAIIENNYDKTNPSVQLKNSLSFSLNLEKRYIKVLLSAEFHQENGPFLLIEIGCSFEIDIENWNLFYNIELNEVKLPKALATNFVVLTMGTLRGVLHAKVENTAFNMFLLPTINVTQLVKEDVSINMNSLDKN